MTWVGTEALTRMERAMQSLTNNAMPGYHFARIVAAALTIPDPERRADTIESARLLLQRGDR